MNRNITLVELLQGLKKLQRNEATGLDGMKIEFILDTGELLHMPLLITFNYFLAKSFLEALSTGVVHVFFKGGNASEFNNYRGIMVGPILAKLFAMILDKRLSKWAEEHGLRAKGQIGFRKDYRIIDHVATLTRPSVGVKPNTWKSWGFGVLRDSRMFRARQQGPKHLALGCSWCH
jgi:hypothetical protein